MTARRGVSRTETFHSGTSRPGKENGMATKCAHRDQRRLVTPNTSGCEGCLAAGQSWVELRMCLVCGHVGCCDSSKGRHATRHFEQTGHPIMKSIEPGADWSWCYVDKGYI